MFIIYINTSFKYRQKGYPVLLVHKAALAKNSDSGVTTEEREP